MVMTTNFDPETHRYEIDGRPVPSVTQVLRDMIPGWSASDWHLQRGRAVHACCAMIARGLDFSNDPQIDGQVRAARLWYAHTQPLIVAVERAFFSRRYQFAGTPDLIVSRDGLVGVMDFKANLGPSVPYQLGAYSMLYAEHARCAAPRWGWGVELREDGSYRMSDGYDLKPYAQRFLALLSAYNTRRECKIKEVAE